MKELFATSKNGISVYLDTEQSHASTHLAHNPALADFAREVLSGLDITEDIVRVEQDMGKVIGTTDLLETDENDEIVYALRPLRSTYSRFVKNKKPISTRWVTVDVRKREGDYFLYTTFIGRLTPSFPGGDYLLEQSEVFWSNHALAWGNQEVIPETETTECPWVDSKDK